MTLFHRGGKWYIRYYGPDGRQRWETIGPNKKEAETVLAQRLYEVRSGKYPILRRRSRMRFAEFAEEWLQNHAKARVRASTWSTYHWLSASHLNPAFGFRFLATLTHKDISDYIAEKIQTGKIAPRTVNHSLVLLKAMLEAAVDWGYLPHNPGRKVRKLKIGRADPPIWTIGEIRRFLLNIGDDWRPLFLVALFAGLRLGEIQALAWDRQNRPMFATRKIEVRSAYNERTGVLGRPKSDTSLRAVDMVPSVYHALVGLSMRTAAGLVFPGPGGKPLAAWMLYDHGLRPAIERAGVNRIRFHDLRHTYASLLIMAGKHPKYIADQMGHASAAFTLETYGHLMGRLPVQPVEWIDDLVFPEGLEAALKLHLLGGPNSATQGHPMSDAEEQLAVPDRPQTPVK